MAENTQQCVRDDVNVCQLCGELENLLVCGACKNAWYCSKSHQRQDWKQHKHACKRMESCDKNKWANEAVSVSCSRPVNTSEDVKLTSAGSKSPCMLPSEGNSSLEKSSTTSSKVTTNSTDGNNSEQIQNSLAQQAKVSISKEEAVKTVNNNLTRQVQLSKTVSKRSKKEQKTTKACNDKVETNGQQHRYYLGTTQLSLPPSVCEFSAQKQNSESDMGKEAKAFSTLESKEQYLLILQTRFNEVAKYVVKCLSQYGICVVDKFLGEATAQEILKEVIQLQTSGVMNQGQIANGPLSSSENEHIRGDIITWVEGTEAQCENIHYLISCMDTVMLEGVRNLENCTINERTKAMVACYPGEGRGYVRHVDNPSGDGRRITCIYYLNKDWDVRVDGGLLRIYPEGLDQLANIEPVCDRLLFFWSDRRNPHEVEKAQRERYAITVWYYDADERAEALRRLKVDTSTGSKKLSSSAQPIPSSS